ncbi:MAG: hypothetical protein CVV42_02540 [Candidatus Riflebacteria bacterium HGW-Riflebacteria-2]|jgi:hypothetical protein|nr:MAG: hypothetical protein CVV42_02540 [Candidatus Riflebacteria bacterium HGW-Riflebacteria-2]
MSDKECEKIIDRAIESNKADAATEAHARTCPKCASTLALLALLKTSGSPTSDLKPSAAFLASIESSLTATAAQTITLKTKILAAVIGVALTATIALTIISHTGKSDKRTDKAAQSGSVTDETTPAASSNTGEIRPNTDNTAFPQLKFPSPTDEIK